MNNQFIKTLQIIVSGFFLLGFLSCKKFLDEKPDIQLAVPKSIDDVQRLVDRYTLNTLGNLGAQSDDDFYMADNYYSTVAEEVRMAYIWEKDLDFEQHWLNMYSAILSANTGLETLDGIRPSSEEQARYNRAKGSALYTRSRAFFDLVQYYAKPYQDNASNIPGIPLRLSSDIAQVNSRNSLEESYRQIITDLKHSVPLLPVIASPLNRPSKAASYAMLANVYMAMRNYPEAGKYADSSLRLYSNLIDYNSLNPNAALPFSFFNQEVIIGGKVSSLSRFNINNYLVDSILFQQYHSNDLRKVLFYRNLGGNLGYAFKGNYEASSAGELFNGYTTAEMYLIRAEARAREGMKDSAMADLNSLLRKRWKTNTFIPFAASSSEEALTKVLLERRKELAGRSRRWFDLRRLNQEPAFAKTLRRKVNGVVYELAPNDKRYTFYIPLNVINFSGMEQNIR